MFAPLTFNDVDAPLHIEVFELPLNAGTAFTVTATVVELVHPVLAVPVTV